jgi:hypothetical protein
MGRLALVGTLSAMEAWCDDEAQNRCGARFAKRIVPTIMNTNV